MTREEILAMEPDELNIAVAEKVFQAKVIGKENDPHAKLLIGWYGNKAWRPMSGSWSSADWSQSEEIAWLDCPRFSEEISAAWEVVTKLDFDSYYIEICTDQYELNKWICRIGTDIVIVGNTAPEVICKAALIATMEAAHEVTP